MKKDLTEVVFILDKSGSMSNLTSDTIGGFNSLLKKQKEEKGECLVSTVLFNDKSYVLIDRKPIKEVKEMSEDDYCASGCTALIDALGDAIKHIKRVHKYIREEDRPEHTMFIITTDGLENASHKYSSDDVKKLVEGQKEAGWEFVFLGANIDAVETAKSYGIRADRSTNYINDACGIEKNFGAVAGMMSNMRTCGAINEDWDYEIKEDYKKRKKAI